MPETLMARTRRLLRESGMSLPAVYAELRARGSRVSYYWLRKFSTGEYADPSVNRVEELYCYLTGKEVLFDGKKAESRKSA